MSFLRKGLLFSVGHVASVVVTMLTGIILARKLGPDGVGQVELFRSSSLIATTVLALGIGNAIIFFINSGKASTTQLVSDVLRFSVVSGGVLAVGLAVAVFSWPNYFGIVSKPTTLIYASGTAALLIVAVLRPVLVAQLSVLRMVCLVLIPPSTFLAVTVGLAISGLLNAEVAIALTAATHFMSLLILLCFLHREIEWKRRFKWQIIWKLIVYGLQLAAANLLYVIGSNFTILLLRGFSKDGFDDVGLYTRAVAISTLAILVPQSLGTLLYAKWSGLTGERKRREVEMAARMNGTYGLFMCIVIMLLGKYLLWFLYGNKFVGAQPALLFLAPAIALTALQSPIKQLLASEGKAWISALILFGNVCVVVGFAFSTIPVYGLRGAAFAVLCGNIFTAVCLYGAAAQMYGVYPAHCILINPSDLRHMVRSLIGNRSNGIILERVRMRHRKKP